MYQQQVLDEGLGAMEARSWQPADGHLRGVCAVSGVLGCAGDGGHVGM